MSMQWLGGCEKRSPEKGLGHRLFFGVLTILTLTLVWRPAEAQESVDMTTDADIQLTGETAGDAAGYAVTSGDVNADGFDDLIISALAASPAGRSRAGKVYVIFGDSALSASIGLASADLVILGSKADDQLGISSASGDVNGDGIDDIIIGANSADPGDPTARNEAGKVYVIYGKAPAGDGSGGLPGTIDLSTTSADVEVWGDMPGDFLGSSVASGDVNGDEIDDIIIGATRVEVGAWNNVGAAYIIYGKAPAGDGSGGLPGTIDLSTTSADIFLEGRDASDNCGSAVATADLNGDQVSDIIIGASSANPGGLDLAGEIYIVYGTQELYSSEPGEVISLWDADVTLKGGETYFIGGAIDVGDVNRDRIDDLIFGGPGFSPAAGQYAGVTYVMLGDPGLLGDLDLDSMQLTVWGDAENAQLGWAVATGNFNGDGFDDIITAALYSSAGAGRDSAGRVFVIYGDLLPSGILELESENADLTILGEASYDNLGYQVDAGDIDDDGVQDLIIATPQLDSGGAGKVYVIFGRYPTLKVSVDSASPTYNELLPLSISIDEITAGMVVIEADVHIAYNNILLTLNSVQKGALIQNWDLQYQVVQGDDADENIIQVRVERPLTEPTVEGPGQFIHLDFTVNDVRRALTDSLVFEVLSFNGGRTEWNEITQPVITLTGNDGSIAASVVSEPGDTLRVRVSDVDLNVNSTAEDAVLVQLRNWRTNEVETVQLIEQGLDDSVFFGQILTAFDTGDTGALIDDDGTLIALAGDTLSFTYTDSLSAAGPETLRVENHWVLTLGDADGNGQTQAFDASHILGHALQQITLTGVDSLAANVDALAPYGEITSYDAALVIQRRLGLIDRFPVQATTSDNHPRPGGQGAGKPVPEERWLTLIPEGEQIVVWAAEREGIIAADLVAEGVEGMVEMAPELAHFQTAVRSAKGDLRIAFAGDQGVRGPGELFRIIPTGESRTVQGLRGRFNGGRMVARAETQTVGLPRHLTLHPNSPNPFNPETLIRVDLPADQEVRLEVFNTLGQKVRTLATGRVEGGSHQFRWDSRDEQGQPVASGIYLYRLTTGQHVQTRRMLLVK